MRTRRCALGATAALALATPAALALATAPAALADTSVSTLSVDGQGSVFVTPDVADLTITVSRGAGTSRLALSHANAVTRAVVGAERALGVPSSGIQTEDVNVASSVHRAGPSKRLVRLWSASETLDVRLTDAALAGPAIDAATRAGASGVDGPTYSFSDPTAGKLVATRAAIADAQRRAADAAAAIGYQVTGVQSLQIDPPQNVVPPYAAAPSAGGVAGKGVPTSVHPGTEEVDAEVAIVFTIAPV